MISFCDLQYLSSNGFLSRPAARFLDIGSQNLLNATMADVLWLAARHGGCDPANLRRQAVELAYFSTPRPGETTTYLADVLALTDIDYTSYDVAPGARTTIFDLNGDSVPEEDRGSFDVVLNAGTSEHVFNQLHCFRVVHDALRVNGVALHILPAAGWTSHGYFAYRPQFFRDLAVANSYALLDMWYSQAGVDRLDASIDIRDASQPLAFGSGKDRHPTDCLNWNLNVLLKKDYDTAFRWGLELATSHTPVDAGVAARYGLAP